MARQADHDLEDLYNEGFRVWGETQADRFYAVLAEWVEIRAVIKRQDIPTRLQSLALS